MMAKNFVFVTFKCEADRQEGMAKLQDAIFKGSKLSVKVGLHSLLFYKDSVIHFHYDCLMNYSKILKQLNLRLAIFERLFEVFLILISYFYVHESYLVIKLNTRTTICIPFKSFLRDWTRLWETLFFIFWCCFDSIRNSLKFMGTIWGILGIHYKYIWSNTLDSCHYLVWNSG